MYVEIFCLQNRLAKILLRK